VADRVHQKQDAAIDIRGEWAPAWHLVFPRRWAGYKLSAIFENGQPKLKVSDDPEDHQPGVKKVIRFFDERDLMRGDAVLRRRVIPTARSRYFMLLSHAQDLRSISDGRRSWFRFSRQENWSTPNPRCRKFRKDPQSSGPPPARAQRLQSPHIYHVSLEKKLFRRNRS
jgi:hypothetical protein